jgi:hypothetical protein
MILPVAPSAVIEIGSAAFVVPGHAAGTTGHVGQLGHAGHRGFPEIRLNSVWNVLSPEEAVSKMDFIETI